MTAHLLAPLRALGLSPAALVVACSLALSGCAGSDPEGTADAPPVASDAAPADPAAADPSAVPPAADPAAAPGDPAAKPAEMTRMAKVVEAKTAGGYTYAKMDACGQEAWVAGPPTDLKVGASVTMPMGTAMQDFKAPGMDQTFALILFVDWFKPVEGEPPPCPEIAAAPPGTEGHGAGPSGSKEPRFLAVVTQTMKSGGYTYAELDRCGKKEWLAGPGIPTKVGDTLSVPEGNVMTNFEAKSLGRTFEAIRFVGTFAISAEKPKCK